MKILLSILPFVLGACSSCDIPSGAYQAAGGSESLTFLSLEKDTVEVIHEHWSPTKYDQRTQEKQQGTWSCKGRKFSINTPAGVVEGELISIGDNPLGLDKHTQALVSKPSSNAVLSDVILYPSETYN